MAKSEKTYDRTAADLFATQSEPIVVTYTGGYTLPDKAPPALKQATEIMVLEGRALRRS